MSLKIHLESILSGVKFTKKGNEIKNHIEKRVNQLTLKIKEREERIVNLRNQYDISELEMSELLVQAANDRNYIGTYSVSNSILPMNGSPQTREKVVPAGVVQNILTEKDAQRSEKEQVSRLELISRNLDKDSLHNVSLGDLEYLGF